MLQHFHVSLSVALPFLSQYVLGLEKQGSQLCFALILRFPPFLRPPQVLTLANALLTAREDINPAVDEFNTAFLINLQLLAVESISFKQLLHIMLDLQQFQLGHVIGHVDQPTLFSQFFDLLDVDDLFEIALALDQDISIENVLEQVKLFGSAILDDGILELAQLGFSLTSLSSDLIQIEHAPYSGFVDYLKNELSIILGKLIDQSIQTIVLYISQCQVRLVSVQRLKQQRSVYRIEFQRLQDLVAVYQLNLKNLIFPCLLCELYPQALYFVVELFGVLELLDLRSEVSVALSKHLVLLKYILVVWSGGVLRVAVRGKASVVTLQLLAPEELDLLILQLDLLSEVVIIAIESQHLIPQLLDLVQVSFQIEFLGNTTLVFKVPQMVDLLILFPEDPPQVHQVLLQLFQAEIIRILKLLLFFRLDFTLESSLDILKLLVLSFDGNDFGVELAVCLFQVRQLEVAFVQLGSYYSQLLGQQLYLLIILLALVLSACLKSSDLIEISDNITVSTLNKGASDAAHLGLVLCLFDER